MNKRLLREIRSIQAYLAAAATIAAVMGLVIVAQAAAITQVINNAFLEHQSVSQLMGY